MDSIKKIYLGDVDAESIIRKFVKKNDIKRIYVIGDQISPIDGVEIEWASYAETIMYRTYYKWLTDINRECLIVWNKAMRTVKRSDLHYNCIRKYMIQTENRLLFEYFPIRQNEEDFMILWDMIQPNPNLKESYKEVQFKKSSVHIGTINVDVEEHHIELSKIDLASYEDEKKRLIEEVEGNKKDPDIIPRRLLKFVEKIGAKIAGLKSYDTKATIKPRMVVTVSQTGVDKHYMEQINKFKESVKNVIKKIQSGN